MARASVTRAGRMLTGLILVCLATGCAHDAAAPDTAADGSPVGALRPSLSASATVPADQWPIHFSPATSNDSLVGALDSFPTRTLLHITQSGSVTEYWTSALSPANAGKPKATYTIGGGFEGGACYANVDLWAGQTSVGWCRYPGAAAPAAETYTVVVGQGHLVWNQRGYSVPNGSSEYCGRKSGIPCFTYSGSITGTIERVAATLTLTAGSSAVAPGQQLTLTATVSPATTGGHTMPFTVRAWRFVADSGSAAGPSCAPPPEDTNPVQCPFTPGTSGTVYLDAIVNGKSVTVSQHIAVFSCLTGDSLLDNPDIRQGLRDAWSGSNSHDPNPYNRTERVGGLDCPTADVCAPILFQPTSNDNWCTSDFSDKNVPGTVRVIWHTHPFDPENPADIVPASPMCPGISGSQPVADRPTWPDDYQAGAGWDHIVVNEDWVTVIPKQPWAGIADPLKSVRWYPRNGSGSNVCDPLAPPII